MKLSGNKLAVCALASLLSGISTANTTSPELVEFKAGTPAKAAEVNGNFQQIKAYAESLKAIIDSQSETIAQLQDKVNQLENTSSDEFTIPVKGDGELIGYTNRIPKPTHTSQMLLKTTMGLVKLKGGYNDNFVLDYYDEQRPSSEGWGDAMFLNANCTNPVAKLTAENTPMTFTKSAGVISQSMLLPSPPSEDKESYVLEQGTAIVKVDTLYSVNWEGNCVAQEWVTANTPVAAIVPLDPAVHGLKDQYSTISIEGYVLN